MVFAFVCLCATLVAYAGATCDPNGCNDVACEPVDPATCEGKVEPYFGYCGCCPKCVKQLGTGEACTPWGPSMDVTSECAAGTQCDWMTRTCTETGPQPGIGKRQTGPCTQRLAEVEARLAASNGMLLGLERPRCDADGNYAGMQFAGSQAYCVTKNGTAISGYMVNRWETGPDMNCRCARDLYDYMATGLIGLLFNCEPNGNYASTQCTGAVCYCVDTAGNRVGTKRVHVAQLGSLNC